MSDLCFDSAPALIVSLPPSQATDIMNRVLELIPQNSATVACGAHHDKMVCALAMYSGCGSDAQELRRLLGERDPAVISAWFARACGRCNQQQCFFGMQDNQGGFWCLGCAQAVGTSNKVGGWLPHGAVASRIAYSNHLPCDACALASLLDRTCDTPHAAMQLRLETCGNLLDWPACSPPAAGLMSRRMQAGQLVAVMDGLGTRRQLLATLTEMSPVEVQVPCANKADVYVRQGTTQPITYTLPQGIPALDMTALTALAEPRQEEDVQLRNRPPKPGRWHSQWLGTVNNIMKRNTQGEVSDTSALWRIPYCSIPISKYKSFKFRELWWTQVCKHV